MKQKIRQLADIRSGYQFRGKVVHNNQGNVDVIQIKDVNDRQEIDTRDLTRVTLENPDRYLIEPGDVLFLSRGQRMYGTIVPELCRDTVASSYFFVLHPKSDRVEPGYLAWFLNEPGFQRMLQSLVRGSHMPLVSMVDFKALQVNIPDIETQHRIVQLNELMLKEAHLLDQLKAKRAELIEGVSRSLLSGRIKTKD